MTNILYYFLALLTGGILGYTFGRIQKIAREKYLKRQQSGSLKGGSVIIPGSIQRTAFFLILLVLIQIGLPALFNGSIQWMVSAGVIIGYGWTLFQMLRERTQRSYYY